jgi:quinolinate synthase
MIALASLAEEILDLKRERRAMILAHHYQDSEIQDLADAVGDRLELARQAQQFSGDAIAFCGVRFMAEPYRKRNTLERLRDCLLHLEPRVELAPDVIERARIPIERMLRVS